MNEGFEAEGALDADPTQIPPEGSGRRNSAAAIGTDAAESHGIGLVVDGRYVLEARLGGGGMGVVYRARDQLMAAQNDPDPYVALKLIADSIKQYPEAPMALQRECKRAQKLAHPNVLKVFHFGSDSANYYLTMELLHGQSLETILREHPHGLPWNVASPLIEQLCSGLSYAHTEGLVHSDIKPSNIFVTTEGVLKILDFGIAAPLRRADGAAAETQFNPRQKGIYSPRYSSVEMHLGSDADPRDDVFSAGCVIYEMLAGRHPFGEETTVQAMERGLVPAPIKSASQTQNASLRGALEWRRDQRTISISNLRDGLQAQRRSAHSRGAVLAFGSLALTVGYAAFWLLRSPAVTPLTAPQVTSKPADPAQREGDAVSPPDHGTAVKTSATGACPDLESTWSRQDCQTRKQCFSARANDARVAQSLAPQSLVSLYRARQQMYERLASATCDEMESQKEREYRHFADQFPEKPIN